MKARKFFEKRSDQSEVKAPTVTNCFFTWARAIMPTAAMHGGKICLAGQDCSSHTEYSGT